ncbi:hypothetical protein EYZ11_004518 [Aspergillus tanneri]|uniref:Amidohydrolase-related domain-containing protein n=1 Tax=Aspergillus tanneri TaxID=1220188 RepID=A0A4S3JKA4_9EURO|nr:uncharacterized protein ATNIH1004_011492 [Aspergillus tanneri]KAA8642547.1 hypothetical protein ATNIH1004_011492 [Aspergillus tanneri]THC96019.1 hypothetical protein EYZ11_004518 [Aspergillus tanneri]
MVSTIIHSVLLFDGQSVHQDATVTFDSSTGQITSVSRDKPPFTEGATVIDGRGHTLLPGLIDSHMHAFYHGLPPDAPEEIILQQPIKAGVTTVCDMHCDAACVERRRAQIADDLKQAHAGSGRVFVSDLKTSLLGATIKGGWPIPVVLGHNPTDELKEYVKSWPNVTEDNAEEFIKDHKARGADYIKLMQENCHSLGVPTDSIPSASLSLQTAIVKAAHAENFTVVAHATSLDGTELVLKAGTDGLAHTFVDQPPTQSVIDLYNKTNAFVIPTFVVLSSGSGENQDLRDKFADIAHTRGLIDASSKQTKRDFLGTGSSRCTVEYAYETIRRLKVEGIDILAGTDSIVGLAGTALGASLWMELELFVQKCGFTIPEALRSATYLPAKRLGFDDRGVVAPGKRADLVLVRGDVTQKLQSLWEGEGIVGVWKLGFKAG